MNKRFVKNNIGLLAVVSVCAVIATCLLIFTLVEYAQMFVCISKIEDYRGEVGKIIKKQPAPVDGNRALLQHDIDLYSKTAKQLQAHFGHPMQPAIDTFFATLRTRPKAFGDETPEHLSRAQFLEEFHKVWDSIDQNNYPQKQYFLNNEFRPKFSNWEQAQTAFIKAAQPFTFEELNTNNADEVLLSVLGIPRYLNGDSERLRRILLGDRERLLKNIGDTLQLSTAAMGLGLIPGGNEDIGAMANLKVDDFPVALAHVDIVGDLLSRIKDTGVRTIYDIRIRRGGEGGGGGGDAEGGDKAGNLREGIETAGGYQIYHYQFEVSGSMEAIRAMAAKLDNAFADRRVYIVRSIFLYAEENGAANIFALGERRDDGTGLNANEKRNDNPQGRRRRVRDQGDDAGDDGGGVQNDQDFERKRKIEEALRRYREAQERMPYERRDGYGEILIGSGESYRAVIDVEYVAQAGR